MTDTQIQASVDQELTIGTKRSAVYRTGILDLLRFKLMGTPWPSPHKPGTLEHDAYYAGVERGWHLLRRLQSE